MARKCAICNRGRALHMVKKGYVCRRCFEQIEELKKKKEEAVGG